MSLMLKCLRSSEYIGRILYPVFAVVDALVSMRARIRIQFFYLNSDPDPVPGTQNNADPCGSGSESW
jgi:hypothetical protein